MYAPLSQPDQACTPLSSLMALGLRVTLVVSQRAVHASALSALLRGEMVVGGRVAISAKVVRSPGASRWAPMLDPRQTSCGIDKP